MLSFHIYSFAICLNKQWYAYFPQCWNIPLWAKKAQTSISMIMQLIQLSHWHIFSDLFILYYNKTLLHSIIWSIFKLGFRFVFCIFSSLFKDSACLQMEQLVSFDSQATMCVIWCGHCKLQHRDNLYLSCLSASNEDCNHAGIINKLFLQ